MYNPFFKCPSCGQDQDFDVKWYVYIHGYARNNNFIVDQNFREIAVTSRHVSTLSPDSIIKCSKCQREGYMAEFKKEAETFKEQVSALVDNLNKERYNQEGSAENSSVNENAANESEQT